MLICLNQHTGTLCGAHNSDGACSCQKCGYPLDHVLPLQNPGTLIAGRYRILGIIGHGSAGAVYQAEDLQQPLTHVAIKEIVTPAVLYSFQRQFDMLQHLQHPHLPRYYDLFEAGQRGYLVMEFIAGPSLHDLLLAQPTPLTEQTVVPYAQQVCAALHALHSQPTPILHGDIKPVNIRVVSEGVVKLVDISLAQQGHSAPLAPCLMSVYTPIEQWCSTALYTAPQSDVYSLGATMYHLLTGYTPLPVIDRVAAPNDPLMPAQQLQPTLSAHGSTVVMTALAIHPPGRYIDAQAFQQALSTSDSPQQIRGTSQQSSATLHKSVRKSHVRDTRPRTSPTWVWRALVPVIVICLLVAGMIALKSSPYVAALENMVQIPTMTAPTEAEHAAFLAQHVQATATAVAWPVVFAEPFDNHNGVWPVGRLSDAFFPESRLSIDGTYRWNVQARRSVTAPRKPLYLDAFADFVASVEMRQVSGPDSASYGVLFRQVDEQNFYNFRINNRGAFAFSLLEKNEWKTIIDWTESSVLAPDTKNHITIIADDAQFSFFINDQFVASADDTHFRHGKLGLVVGLHQAGDAAIIEFDNFEIRAP